MKPLLLAALVLLLAPATSTAAVDFSLDRPERCEAGSCTATVTYVPAPGLPVRLEVDFDHAGAPDQGFVGDGTAECSAVSGPCTLTGPPYQTVGLTSVVVRVIAPDGLSTFGARPLRVEAPPADEPASDGCGRSRPGEQCGPGDGRRTPGGGEKVSHKGWPSITGILWKVLDAGSHQRVGGPLNDELLGHHGNDRIDGGGGKDVIWGDWNPVGNGTGQRDVLAGGAGNDWIYSSHGHNAISGGEGRDYVWAYYGRGTIDCGPGGQDTARVRLVNGYRIRNCERIVNFCAYGSKPGGGCYKPGERPSSRRRGRP